MTDNGTGWGRFDATVAIPEAPVTDGRLVVRVFAFSAEDGSEIDVLEVPVTLAPSG